VTGVSSRDLGYEWNAWTGTAGLEWSPTSETLVFGKYSRGYKTGAFNATNLTPLPLTDPEYVNSYELGWKQEVPEWDLTANMSLFLYEYTDIQVPLTEILNIGEAGETRISALRNIPQVQTTGFELESTWRPVDDLTLRFTYAYLKPEITESGLYLNGDSDDRSGHGSDLHQPDSVARRPRSSAVAREQDRFQRRLRVQFRGWLNTAPVGQLLLARRVHLQRVQQSG